MNLLFSPNFFIQTLHNVFLMHDHHSVETTIFIQFGILIKFFVGIHVMAIFLFNLSSSTCCFINRKAPTFMTDMTWTFFNWQQVIKGKLSY